MKCKTIDEKRQRWGNNETLVSSIELLKKKKKIINPCQACYSQTTKGRFKEDVKLKNKADLLSVSSL